MEKNMKSIAANFEKFCENHEFTLEREDDEDGDYILYRLNIGLDCSLGTIHYKIIFEENVVTIIGDIDANAGKRKNEVGEFLMRLNDDEYLGHMQMDYDSGDILYQTRLGYETFTEEDDFHELNRCSINRAEMYGDSLMKVILGVMSPKEAYDEVQKRLEEDQAEDADSAEDSEDTDAKK